VRLAARGLGRLKDIRDAADYDLIFIHRECFPLGPALIERALRKQGPPMVLDFDDAIYLPRPGYLKNLLRNPAKTAELAQLADHVVVANDHLGAFARAYNRHVTVIPTCVDTEELFYQKSIEPSPAPRNGKRVRLGWIGSHSTAKYLEQLAPVLARVAARHPIELLVVGAGRDLSFPGVSVINKAWSLETETDDFRSLDIGVYPLHDDLWELGKPSFKTIQYMAVGVPGVISSVGSAKRVVADGVDGFLAANEDEWVDKICRLIEDPELRERIAAAGRIKAVREYSIAANAPKLLQVLREAASRGRG
jgi:glycosyltransferase involved in cell wall biosynthesis